MAAVPLLALTAPTVALAQAVDEYEVGDRITDPTNGDTLIVRTVFEGAILTADGMLVLTDPSVGAMVPDPNNGSVFVEVTAVNTNAGTGLVEQVTLSDGRTIDVVRDVSDQLYLQSSADPLAAFSPLAPPDETKNQVSTTRNGSNGSAGADGVLIALPPNAPEPGGNGTTRSAGTFTYDREIEVALNFSNRTGIFVSGRGGNGGSGGDGLSVVVASFNGREGGDGGNGTQITVNNDGTVSTGSFNGLYGIYARSIGGNGGDGGDGKASVSISNGGDGGDGGNGGTVTINNRATGNVTTFLNNAFGLYARSIGGQGGDGGSADPAFSSVAGSAGSAGNGGSVRINNFGKIHTFGNSAHGIVGQSLGGTGGSGGDASGIIGGSGAGSAGGRGGSVVLDNEAGGFIYTGGNDAHGILAQSIGGGGGAAGSASGLVALGNSAGSGKEGGTVTVRNFADGTIVTEGERSFGMIAQSVGGGGGSAGLSGGLVAIGGSGGSGGIGKAARAQNDGLIVTSGDGSHAMVAQSVGGGGGTGASSAGFVAVGGSGSKAGNGGTSRVDNTGTVQTSGDGAHGALVQSIGGGGGNAGITGGAISVGGSGSSGGRASTVTYVNTGLVETSGLGAFGVLAQSIGGGGGNGAASAGLIAIGGSSSGGGRGGAVNITQGGTILTTGDFSTGIVAQSVGGGGGNGGLAAGASAFVGVAVGGKGGGGGDGGIVTVTHATQDRVIDGVTRTLLPVVHTTGNFSTGVFAQSVGGGGGNGGAAIQTTLGLFGSVSVAVGGSGGSGGKGGTVNILDEGIILTDGAFSHGLFAQSVGGGGGNGGNAVSISGSLGAGGSASVSVGVGGSGGSGGDGGLVNIDSGGFIGTTGDFSHGLFAQSVGGGGGNGGFSVSAALAVSDGVAVSIPVGVGGSGGFGGDGDEIDSDFAGDIRTSGSFSHGLLTQSVGGGGGNGGFNVSVGVAGAGGGAGGVAIGVGGTGGGGGDGGIVNSALVGNIVTEGAFSNAYLAQSVGGSGGNGAYNVSGGVALSGGASGALAVGVGGSGGGAGTGKMVTASIDGDITTLGAFSNGFIAQSIGGGGGNGGLNVSGTISAASSGAVGISVGIGGAGGKGGAGGIVEATVSGDVTTFGDGSQAVLAQSLGGGGGNGALNVSAGITASSAGGTIGIGVGGAGGEGGASKKSQLVRIGNTVTMGDDATAVISQSLGGGGGNGGVNVTGGVTLSTGASGTIGVGVGGFGGKGGGAELSTLTLNGDTYTKGDNSTAVISQSIGGGGGNGALNVTGSISASSGGTGTLGIGLGGFGGSGGIGGIATAGVAGTVSTTGKESNGILVQSVGGGGGAGGTNITGSVAFSTTSSFGGAFGLGGFGGSGQRSNTAQLFRIGDTFTSGAESDAIVVQSVGGGGGQGALNIAGGVSITGSGASIGASVGLGGFGGGGGDGGSAFASISGNVIASGLALDTLIAFSDGLGLRLRSGGSHGILVQSVGGGGGNGGTNISGGVSVGGSSAGAKSLGIGVGGFGGGGGIGSSATLLTDNGLISGIGDYKSAALVQSVGGGGGDGGFNIAGGISVDGTIAVGVGGDGGDGGTGGTVVAMVNSDLNAAGTSASGLLAQSIGGGGGNGGINITGGISAGGAGKFPAVAFGIGGSGGTGSRSGAVTAEVTGNVTVEGARSRGVIAQSVGGGGGNGALNVAAAVGTARNFNLGIALGGSGGAGADGGAVTVTSDGMIMVDALAETGVPDVASFDSGSGIGLLAQSVGGGGGNAGFNVAGAGTNQGAPVSLAIGGRGDNGGKGGDVLVERGLADASLIHVLGDYSTGLLAQSLGGGGGNANGNLLMNASLRAKFDAQIGIGGAGGTGGDGGNVTVTHIGDINVEGEFSNALMAQSVGGGGGNAGYNVNVSLVGNRKNSDGQAAGTKALDLVIGGGPGEGSDGGLVLVDHNGILTTTGGFSTALLAQSIGGGGGNAGTAFSQNWNDDSAISLTFGRVGGTGGVGGEVNVTAAGMIHTSGDTSHGIHAQSIGGGGGTSSTTSLNVSADREKQSAADKEKTKSSLNLEFALGLEGGVGSRASGVTVTNSATIMTEGLDAHGIFAQSIGGGGGAGGAALIDTRQEVLESFEPGDSDDSKKTGISLAYQAGGKGGTGAEGGSVDVTNNGIIVTLGSGANAIKAQSIGGGGGEGGAVFNLAAPGKDDSYGLEVSSGGDGGTGALGGNVTVTNLGQLETQGEMASAIHAQSIGGGGGNGGLAGNINIANADEGNTSVLLIYNIGGKGGIGGAAGNVTVANGSIDDATATILTLGGRSHGIFAQSIGGGGGNGGMTLSGNYASGTNNVQLGLSIGGDGETGGAGGAVTVDNFGAIQTGGESAHGVFAQSIGGGGGNGGLSLVGSLTSAAGLLPNQAIIALGGNGGLGNDAGTVTVNNAGTVFTSGKEAHGIVAQSLGGGGGNMSVGISLSQNKAFNYIANTVGLALGGRPGEGGLGGEVIVNHSGDITVTGEGSYGVVAESINGGGGGLSFDIDGVVGLAAGVLPPGVLDPDAVADIPALTIFGGAAGQGDANADKVTLNLTGNITATGDNGAAINQQSVGGGGGRIVARIGFAAMDAADGDPLAVESTLGGIDGMANNGGEIESLHVGDIVVTGLRTNGLFLQSIGGGGGRTSLIFTGPAQRLGELSLALGGTGQSNSAGGSINHAQTGSIFSGGDGAPAALVQSIGGGGGLMAVGFEAEGTVQTTQEISNGRRALMLGAPTPVNGTLTMGADGGSGLSGGDVALVQTGDILATGFQSSGLLIQSIGAGGGYADIGGLDGVAITLGGAGGAQGDGGNVSLTMNGSLKSEGADAYGIVLQSIGGGGGFVAGAGSNQTSTDPASSSGDGGAVSLVLNGDIATLSDGAHAIVAQSLGGGGGIVAGRVIDSAGGAGAGGAIEIAVDGDAMALGDGASAIFAQSVGTNGGGNIAISIESEGMAVGGAGGNAVALIGGANNVLTNNGMLTTLDGMIGTPVLGTDGNDSIINNGVLLGNIDLGGGANALTNSKIGQFVSSQTLNLGSPGNTFTSSGWLAPGDLDTIAQTSLSGSFLQTSTGSTFIELDLATGEFDAIDATGMVEVNGFVDVRLLNPTQFTPGMLTAQIFTGDGGATLGDVDLRADSSVVFNLLGIAQEGNAVVVNYDLTYAPQEAIGNRATLGEYLNRVQTNGVPAALQPTYTQLFNVQDAAEYVDLLTQLGSEFYAEQNAHALSSAQHFISRMIHCGSQFEGKWGQDAKTCVWGELDLADGSLDPQEGMPGIDSEAVRLSAGLIRQLKGNWSLAAALNYSDHDLMGYGDRWIAKGEAMQGALGVRYDMGRAQVGAYASIGSHSYDTMRLLPGFGGDAQGSRDVLAFTGQVTGSYELGRGGFSAVPSLALGATSLSKGGSMEDSSRVNALAIESAGGTHAWAMPGLGLAYTAAISDSWSLRPFANATLRYHLTDPQAEVSARFAADDSGADPFLAVAPLGRAELSGEAGVEFFNSRGMSFGASYRLGSASDRDGEVITVRLSYPF
ncbi:hypothetical protein [Altererythrobacter sp. MF3-039]|uniref:hypothetical protein n=1 Tax=Altererythrobacter sp. MF3-039 TaxID=3252901 RepID=UPI00390CA195